MAHNHVLTPKSNPSVKRMAGRLDRIRLDDIRYQKVFLKSGTSVDLSDPIYAAMYLVTSGECWIEHGVIDRPVHLRQGDVVMLPIPTTHKLLAGPEISVLVHDNQPTTTELGELEPNERDPLQATMDLTSFCAEIALCQAVPDDSIASLTLPRFVHLPCSQSQVNARVMSILDLIAQYSTEEEPLKRSIQRRLTEVLAMEFALYALTHMGEQDAWVASIADPHIGRALEIIHKNPSMEFSLSQIASEVGVSRSVFAKKFCDIVGIPPNRYLRSIRLATAAKLIREGGTALSQVHWEIGYSSESAFIKAFTAQFGVTPGKYREINDDDVH